MLHAPVPLCKVLIANRGEIAVRIARACRDASLDSVAVYADPDQDAPFVMLADEALPLGGSTPGDSYLDAGKILAAAMESGADAIHPGYGFLSENADFAQAVVDAGLVWVGPPPQAIRELGNKVSARRIAARVGAPLVPGTSGPVTGAEEVAAFAEEHGLPVAIKAAFGGGGRGLKVARRMDEIGELYDSAVREAVSAFGRGECFVERYLDRPRHVEAQILADSYGGIVVVGTRDCSLQRRYQKLVEEAPAPFLSDEQRRTIHESAKAICREAGYQSAGTVEYLVATDGTISFLEVNTRLQVEHPVTEETTGIDLVREQFRIAAGERLRLTADPESHGHAIEFRINCEDAGRNFLPTPGTVLRFSAPTGPGVRTDAGVRSGSIVEAQFDSMLAKLIVVGEDRRQALERSRRALRELVVAGVATVVPFHQAILDDPAFSAPDGEPFTVHTRWIETEFRNDIVPFDADDAASEQRMDQVRVELGGRELSVSLPGVLAFAGRPLADGILARQRERTTARVVGGPSGGAVTAPMQGTVVKVAVTDGQTVSTGDLLVVVEAMKMENPVRAHKDGTISGLVTAAGTTVGQGSHLCTISSA